MSVESLTLVRDAINRGVRVVSQISSTTGLPREVVTDCIKQLHHSGEVHRAPLQSSCPPHGCSGCSLVPFPSFCN
ncbi:MAG: hypothetical protein FWG08_04515 [Propionibacteriaceae bacterium]|nr:hypothetical protein [Propionibacteriaceae bacterium]